MPKIHVLSPQEALKIAAGEVIERPAHVIKELMENALDAGATQITLHVHKAGKELIRIVDNGCGMLPEDAKLCFLPHATSKITSLDDLEQVQSFGFRGEALASISAISHVTLVTKSDQLSQQDVGISLAYSEGRVLHEVPIACPVGSDISIKDLFFNTPVRKKFLKQDDTEWNAIQAVFHAFCLSYPAVHFKLYHDTTLTLNAPPVAHAKDRACQLWDHTFAQHFMPLVSDDALSGVQEKPSFRITGYISRPTFWRYGRQNIYFFVNNRWIKNYELGKALMKGYLNILPALRYPAAVIFIEIDPQFVDVNVHPKKEEIKFIKPGVVQTTLATLVKATLENHVSQTLQPFAPLHSNLRLKDSGLRPAGSPSGRTDQYQAQHQFAYTPQRVALFHGDWIGKEPLVPTFQTLLRGDSITKRPFAPMEVPQAFSPVGDRMEGCDGDRKLAIEQNLDEAFADLDSCVDERILTHTQDTVLSSQATDQQFSIMGQLFNTYIMIEKGNELIFVDQHAAHERILYERYKNYFTQAEGIALLFPEVIALTPSQVRAIMEHKDFWLAQGIDIDMMGEDEIVVRSTPPLLRGPSLKDLLTEAALFIEEYATIDKELFTQKLNDFVHAQTACKAAVRAGDALTPIQMQQLINDLNQTSNRFICIHGRPTMWAVPKNDIEKRFKRA